MRIRRWNSMLLNELSKYKPRPLSAAEYMTFGIDFSLPNLRVIEYFRKDGFQY